MGFKCGLIGLPNVGKSTLFNTLTNLKVPSYNFPFCTINPNLGIVPIYDVRLKMLSKIVQSKKIIPTFMEFFDIAGLVKGAHKGEGLGNKFLEDIKKVDVLIHVIRCFLDETVIHVNGKINPISDIQLINDELIFSDYFMCQNMLSQINKKTKFNNKIYNDKILVLNNCLNNLKNGKKLTTVNFSKDEKSIIKNFNFITYKPTIYVANIDSNRSTSNELNIVSNYLKQDNAEFIALSVKKESSKIDNKDKGKRFFLENNNFHNEELNKLVVYGYNLLNLQTFFTVGIKEIKGWTIKKNTTAIDAAKKIHTDFKKGFIRAKVISYKDFIRNNGEIGSKNSGKCRLEGKNYKVKDGDIINFLFNV